MYHSAGLTKAKKKEEYFRANTEGTQNLLDAALSGNPGLRRFVLISSQTASGPSPTKAPITEDHPAAPITTYGRSKLAAEKACLRLADRIPVTVVRPPVVYGPRDRDVFEFFNTFKKGLQPMVGFSEKYVSMIHVRDLVRGFLAAAMCERATGQTYFISTPGVFGWKEIGEMTRRVMGRKALRVRIPEWGVYVISAFAELFSFPSSKPALINFEKAKDMVQDFWTCDATKARKELGFESEIGLEDGIRDTVEWYVNEGWL
jgi:nucleoside-diphosphate-sugar epimerase